MILIRLAGALARVSRDLTSLGVEYALVGGLAVSVHAEPRTTRDVDLAVSVASEKEADRLVLDLTERGYVRGPLLERETDGRLASVRLTLSHDDTAGIVVDLLFASSGIEPEIVAAAQPTEIFAGLTVPLAQPGHLLAQKVLAGREQDRIDARNLIREASAEDLALTRQALDQIARAGYDRGKRLDELFNALIREVEGGRDV